jgi:alkylhydroperoxidase family enzyme
METVELRHATIDDSKLRTLTSIAKAITENSGHIDNDLKNEFFDQGYDNKALIDLAAVVTAVTFTNYVHGITQVDVDFPEVK